MMNRRRGDVVLADDCAPVNRDVAQDRRLPKSSSRSSMIFSQPLKSLLANRRIPSADLPNPRVGLGRVSGEQSRRRAFLPIMVGTLAAWTTGSFSRFAANPFKRWFSPGHSARDSHTRWSLRQISQRKGTLCRKSPTKNGIVPTSVTRKETMLLEIRED
jgi:hypothetical protein